MLLAASLLVAASAAQAQVVITLGSGAAHDCFLHAKSGHNLSDGVGICTNALEHDMLGRKDRAGTYDNRGVLLDMLGRTQQAREDSTRRSRWIPIWAIPMSIWAPC